MVNSCLAFLFCLPCRGSGFSTGAGAPDFELPDLNGKTISLSDILRGEKPVVLSFFGTWCDSCLKEINDLSEMAPKYNAAVYLVGIDADKEKLSRFAKKHKIPFPVLWDPKAKITGRKYDLFRGAFAVVPKAFIISPAGAIEYVSESYDESKRGMLNKKLGEIKAKKWEKGSEAAIFFTGSANGWLESCNCYRHPYGGFIKLVSYIKSRRARDPAAVFVDSGDFLPPSVSKIPADFIFKSLELANYDAIAVGDQDISYSGLPEAVKLYKLPLIASNLSVCPGGKCAAPGSFDKTIEANGVKIRFLSFIPADSFFLYPDNFMGTLKIKEIDEILKDGKKSDFLVLISHSGTDYDKKIAAEVKGIDLIIGGHSQTVLNKAVKTGETLIVQAGPNIQNIGRLTLKFDSRKKLVDYEHEIIPLAGDIPDDPQIAALVKESKAASAKH